MGGVVGTVLEIHGDRYTLLTGALGDDGNLDGPQPTRIVFVRQAIARKIDRIDDIRDVQVDDASPRRASEHQRIGDEVVEHGEQSSTSDGSSTEDIDDVDGDNATSGGDRGGESEEA